MAPGAELFEKIITRSSIDDEPSTRPLPAAARPLNIVHVITRLVLGGAEENTLATCVHQAARGHCVTVLHGPGADPSWERRFGDRIHFKVVERLVHPIAPTADLAAIGELLSLYRRLQADVVHTHESKAGFVGRVAAALAGAPLIVHTIHIAPFVGTSGAKRRLFLEAERACARLSHLLIAVSRGMQREYLDAHIGGAVPIPVVHSGMQVERFRSAVEPLDWRARIGGWPGPRPRFILKMAAFEERKRHGPLLRALAPGLRERSDACLLLAGDGPDRRRCEAEAERLGIATQVRFLGHDAAPWELVALADLCVHAAEREGLPRSAVQAIAGGKPLVVAWLPGIEEIVADGVNGVVTSADLGDLATQLFALLDAPARLARMQQGARSTDVSSWDERRMGERIDRAYETARLARRQRRASIAAIEFFGLPGCGKTTIAREVVSILRERGQVRFSGTVMGDDLPFVGRCWRRLSFVLPTLVARAPTMLRASRGLTPRNKLTKAALKSWWNFLSVMAMQSRPGHGRLLVADQGVAQGIWSARMRHGSDAVPVTSPAQALDGWIGGTLFINVEAPPSVARQRLGQRLRRTSDFQDPKRIIDARLWEAGQMTIRQINDEIADELARRGLVGRLLRIDSAAGDTPRDRAKAICDHLDTIERSVSFPPT